MIQTQVPALTTYRVTLENFDGRCKKVKVVAANPYDAMAATQKGGWYPVEVVEIVAKV